MRKHTNTHIHIIVCIHCINSTHTFYIHTVCITHTHTLHTQLLYNKKKKKQKIRNYKKIP